MFRYVDPITHFLFHRFLCSVGCRKQMLCIAKDFLNQIYQQNLNFFGTGNRENKYLSLLIAPPCILTKTLEKGWDLEIQIISLSPKLKPSFPLATGPALSASPSQASFGESQLPPWPQFPRPLPLSPIWTLPRFLLRSPVVSV